MLDKALEILGLNLVTTDFEAKGMIPSYMVNTLVYYFIKTKKFNMARQLVKSRRFVQDVNQIDSITGNSTAASTGVVAGSSGVS